MTPITMWNLADAPAAARDGRGLSLVWATVDELSYARAHCRTTWTMERRLRSDR